MKDIQVTAYQGFSKVAGETCLSTIISNIRSSTYFLTVQKVEQQCLMGNIAKANEIKKRLPFFSLTANYGEVRQPYSLLRYNPVITIDVDDIAEDRINAVRQLLESAPDVLAFFLTPKRHGFKIFVYLRTSYACHLRKITFCVPAITYSELEQHHAQMYEAAREHIESLLHLPVDASGKDISRGFFSSYDPQAYLNTELLEEIDEITTTIIEKGTKAAPVQRTKSASGGGAALKLPAATAPISSVSIAPWQEMEYKKALSTTRRSERFRDGNRDNFLFVLGNRCFRKGLDEAVAVALVERDFHQPDMDVSSAIRNAYLYISKTQESEKEKKLPVITQVLDFVGARYEFRRNTILDRLEFREVGSNSFLPFRSKDFNSIYVSLLTGGINCSPNALRALTDSDYAPNFNPFEDYLFNLPPWDGTTDHIGALADTIVTTDPVFWRESFRRWIVGAVACALDDKKVNQLMLILFGGQGKGKSTWIRRLLPPEWSEYYHTGMINPESKDDLFHLSTRFLINMDEFQGVKSTELAGLKRMLTQEDIVLRKVYDMQACTFVRHASFIASTNKRRCLQDIDGNRRFLPSSVVSVDYTQPVNYAGVYGQALALLNSGYRYWYEGDEIDRLNDHNELHRLMDPVEENLFVYYRKPLPEDLSVKWMPASAILTRLSIYGKVQVTRPALQELAQALEKHEFETRIGTQGSMEYKVIEFQMDEVEKNFKAPTN